MTDKSCCWSVTINNPTDDDHKQWASLSSLPWVREVKGQVEKGEEGTVHIQGMVKTQSVRFAQVKKALPRAHIEAARSAAALTKYVSKEETRVSAIPTVKVATQDDIQKRLLSVVLEDLKCSPRTSMEMIQIVMANSSHIKKNWETYLDTAVNHLIFRGYYGVEFVVSNPQIRTAFKKYLPAILYRTYDGQARSEAARSQEGRQEDAQAQSAQGVFEGGGDCSYADSQS